MEKSFNMLTFYDWSRNETVFEESKKLRKYFDIKFMLRKIFEIFLKALNTDQSDWIEARDHGPGYDEVRDNNDMINEYATILAGMSRSRKKFKPSLFKKTYELLTIQYFDKYVEEFFKTRQDDMKPFIEKTVNELIEVWMKRWKIENEVDNLPCRVNKTEECSQTITMYYNLVAMPLIIRESHMGFGTFLSYFMRIISSRNPLSNPEDLFLKNKYGTKENQIQKSMIKVLDALNDDNNRGIDVSAFELVKLLHQNPDESPTKFVNRLQAKYGCTGGKSKRMMNQLESAWTKFDNNEVKENILPCQNVSLYMDRYGSGDYSKCCRMLDLVRFQSMKAVLKLMKYSIQPAVYIEPLDDFLKSYDNLNFLTFNNLTNHTASFWTENLKNLLMERNPNPRILKCSYATREYPSQDKCNMFYNSLTNDGFAYTFNNADFWDMYLDSHYSNLFSKIMRPKGYEKENQLNHDTSEDYTDDGIDWVYPKEGILFPEKSGPTNGLLVSVQRIYCHKNKSLSNLHFCPLFTRCI